MKNFASSKPPDLFNDLALSTYTYASNTFTHIATQPHILRRRHPRALAVLHQHRHGQDQVLRPLHLPRTHHPDPACHNDNDNALNEEWSQVWS